MQITKQRYPFAAIVGQESLKEALLWTAVDPGIGGVLITGTRGTAKSTAVRALAELLPPIDLDTPTPFVELPVGATEDRVIGSLDVRSLLTEGKRRFEPGLLARADRGVLYVDEVNLLPDHLVDAILDAAATGINVVERDGASLTHEARIMLVGTMNPEEGELRPQLLDRFGLCVAISDDNDIDQRTEIIERRIAFEYDPPAFTRAYEERTATLRARIAHAHTVLPWVTPTRDMIRHAARLAIAAHVEGMRADLAIVRTARAIAAFDERTEVTEADVERAALPALAHRRRKADGTPPPAPPPPNRQREEDTERQIREHESGSARPSVFSGNSRQSEVGTPVALHLANDTFGTTRKRMHRFAGRGRDVQELTLGAARVTRTKTPRIAVLATLHAAALEHTVASHPLPAAIKPHHLRFSRRLGRARRLIVFLVDASGSMAAAARMRAAKGALCGLLEDAYHRRDAVALITFRADTAQTLVPPTRSAALVYRCLRTLPSGGRTPMAQGLSHARKLLIGHARRDPNAHAHLIIVSDARTNVPERRALEAALREAYALRTLRLRTLCLDTETGRVRLRNLARVATVLGATYRRLEECNERELGAAVREWAATA